MEDFISAPWAELRCCDAILTDKLEMMEVLTCGVICRGPGAGAEVTAGGVFSDLLRLAAYLGAPS